MKLFLEIRKKCGEKKYDKNEGEENNIQEKKKKQTSKKDRMNELMCGVNQINWTKFIQIDLID